MLPGEDAQHRGKQGQPDSERRPHPGPALLSDAADGLARRAGLLEDAVDAHGVGDVLQLLLAEVFVADGDLGLQMVVHRSRDEDSAGVGQTFQASSDIHAIAEDVAHIEDNITEVDADAEQDPAIRRHPDVALRHAPLHLDGTLDRIDDAGELDQQAVASGLDEAPLVLGDRRVDEFFAVGLELRERAGLVRLHQPAVTDDISRKNRCQPSLHSPLPPRAERVSLSGILSRERRER